MTTGDRLEAAYNKIDKLIRKRLGKEKTPASFSSMVSEAAATDVIVRTYKNDLLEYGDLRNAIVHDRGTHPEVLADPREDAVIKIEKICDRLARPKTLRSVNTPFKIDFFDSTEPLRKALLYMKEKDFSQIVARHEEVWVLLSAEGITHWLEAMSRDDIDIIELSSFKIFHALQFEPDDTVTYLRASDSVERAQELFRASRKRVFSIIVTENGTRIQKPIKIFTSWDLISGVLD